MGSYRQAPPTFGCYLHQLWIYWLACVVIFAIFVCVNGFCPSFGICADLACSVPVSAGILLTVIDLYFNYSVSSSSNPASPGILIILPVSVDSPIFFQAFISFFFCSFVCKLFTLFLNTCRVLYTTCYSFGLCPCLYQLALILFVLGSPAFLTPAIAMFFIFI